MDYYTSKNLNFRLLQIESSYFIIKISKLDRNSSKWLSLPSFEWTASPWDHIEANKQIQ